MTELLLFLYRIRAFLLFAGLELVAAWLIVSRNDYQGFAFLSSSNSVVGNVYGVTSSVSGYFGLKDENEKLLRQNAELQRLLLEQEKGGGLTDSLRQYPRPVAAEFPTVTVYPAKVINNSLWQNDNFLTLNQGTNVGIEQGMGVVSTEGVVGQVKAVSDHFATVYSLLHTNIQVSSQIKRLKTLCTTKWNTEYSQNDYTQASILYLPFHVPVEIGDTVETSGYNAVFPEGVPIGVVNQVRKDTARNFLTVTVELSTDFSKLKSVYVIGDSLKVEQKALEQ